MRELRSLLDSAIGGRTWTRTRLGQRPASQRPGRQGRLPPPRRPPYGCRATLHQDKLCWLRKISYDGDRFQILLDIPGIQLVKQQGLDGRNRVLVVEVALPPDG